jgi:hypothetical protein
MREPPEGFSIVSAVEFEMLSHLPEFERRGDGLVRVDDPEQFVFPQSEWDRYEEIARRVDLECESMDAANATEAASSEMERLLSADVISKVAAKVETPAEAEYRRLFVDPPNHPPSSRPPDWARDRFDPLSGW